MSTEPRSTTSGAGHETKDADVAALLLIAFGLLLTVVVVGIGIWITLQHFRSERSSQTASRSSLSAQTHRFPEPQLQTNPADDLAKLRARDARDLNAYGWIDRKAGVVRVPIERAMELLLQKGLPNAGENQTPLSLMQARPAASETPTPPPHPES